jgi:hypothetical protein
MINLVGRTMRNLGVCGVLKTFCCLILVMIGRAKASVLPEPVLSLATTSYP